MNSDQKAKANEDGDKSQVDVEQKTRRSSILKPQKPRNPLTTLDFSEPNPDNTIAKAARRVSFASSNLVKPFAADPEKNTIWDTTYEEEINHTDSTKSSYEQTCETKSNNFLNLTSIYSPESEFELEVSQSKIWERQKSITEFVTFDKENVKQAIHTENLNCFVGQNNIVPLEHTLIARSNETMDFTLIDKENVYMITKNRTSELQSGYRMEPRDTEKHDLSLITPLNESFGPEVQNIVCKENTMERNNIINKENCNPILNDTTLVTHIDTCPKRISHKSARGCNSKNLLETSENYLARGGKLENRGEQTITCDSYMELTKPILVMDIQDNVMKMVTPVVNSKNKTVYFADEEMDFTKISGTKSNTMCSDGPESELNFTNANFTSATPVSANPYVSNTKKCTNVDMSISAASLGLQDNIANRKTIYMDAWNNDMELTSSLQCHIPRSTIITNTEVKNDVPCKNETVFGGSMDYTLQTDAPNENSNILRGTRDMSKRKTIYFDEFDADLDITMLPNTGIIQECRIASDVNMSRFDDMELTKNILPVVGTGINLTVPEVNFTRLRDVKDPKINVSQSGVEADIVKADSRIESGNLEKLSVDSKLINISPKLCQDVKLSSDSKLCENGDVQRAISSGNSGTAGFFYQNTSSVSRDQVFSSEKESIGNICWNDSKERRQDGDVENEVPLIKDSINITGIKRHSGSENDCDLAIKRKISLESQSQFLPQLSDTLNKIPVTPLDEHSEREMIEIERDGSIDRKRIIEKPTSLGNILSPANNELSEASPSTSKDQKTNLQTSTLSNSNILYSEPMKIKLKSHNLTPISDLCDNLNLQSLNGSLNMKLHPTSTPATSFHMTLTDMNPCAEDTQQLIYATFSKPEVLSPKDCAQSKRSLLVSDKCSERADIKSLHRTVNDIFEDINQSLVCKESIKNSIEKTFGKENVQPELREETENGFGRRLVCKESINNSIAEKLFGNENVQPEPREETVKGLSRSFVCKESINNSIEEKTFEKENVPPEPREETEKGLGSLVCKESINNSIGEKTFGKENFQPELKEETENGLGRKSVVNEISKMDPDRVLLSTHNKTERSCYIEDESQVDLNEFKDLSLGNSSKQLENITVTPEAEHAQFEKNSSRISGPNNYTIRSQIVLSHINEYLHRYEPARSDDHTRLIAIESQSKKNMAIIKDLINNILMSKVEIPDLEEKYKQDMEISTSNVDESATDSEDDKGVPSTDGLVAPKTLCERICEAAERCKNHWKFKLINDEYCFSTLFETLLFKVEVHPALGTVYRVKTATNLRDGAKPIWWYQLKLFRHKLKQENLSAVLGARFDILTLLDYVNMTMEEIINFHLEYIGLEKKYGVSHHFRMNRDLSITIEVINIEFIIHWIITINMSQTTLTSIESIKSESDVGQRVNEEDIRCIAENTPKGTKFLSNFIENLNEYVRRMEKKFKFRRHKYA